MLILVPCFSKASTIYNTNHKAFIEYPNIGMNENCTDSLLRYSTFFGGMNDDEFCRMIPYGNSEMIVVGNTKSTNFPITSDALDGSYNGGYDITISIFNITTSNLVYSTFIGGSGDDYPYDASLIKDKLSVVGSTMSSDLPIGSIGNVSNGLSSDNADGFVLVFDLTVMDISFLSYLGGIEVDYVACADFHDRNTIAVSGFTISDDFPVTNNSFNETYNSEGDISTDCFLTLINITDPEILYSTYIGGSDDEYPKKIIAENGNVTIGGYTRSDDFPVLNSSLENSMGSNIAGFFLKLHISNNSMIFSTYIGGSGGSIIEDFIVDQSGNYYITGRGDGRYPISPESNISKSGRSDDIMIAEIAANVTEIINSVYIGGDYPDIPTRIEQLGNSIFVTGRTLSNDFPTTWGAFDIDYNDQLSISGDAILIKMDRNLSSFQYSTYIGGMSWDEGRDLIPISENNVLMGGSTQSSNFPMSSNSNDRTLNGGADLFLINLDLTLPLDPPILLDHSLGDGFVNLSWDLNNSDYSGNWSNNVYRKETSGVFSIIGNIQNSTWFNDTTVENGKDYSYYITNVNFAGESNESNEMIVRDLIVPSFLGYEINGPPSNGKEFNITVFARDNVIVQSVLIYYEFLGEEHQHDMVLNLTKRNWYHVILIPEEAVGIINVTFSIIDASMNFFNTSHYNFEIIDQIEPIIVNDKTEKEAQAGHQHPFRVHVKDNIGIVEVKVVLMMNDSLLGNISMTEMGPGYWRQDILMPNVLQVLDYHYFIKDVNGNYLITETEGIEVMDIDPPTFIEDLSDYTPFNRKNYTFRMKIHDDIWGIENISASVILRYDEEIILDLPMEPNGDEFQVSTKIPSDVEKLEYIFSFKDGSGNGNGSDLYEKRVYDDILPELYFKGSRKTYTDSYFDFNVFAYDNRGMDDVRCSYYYDDDDFSSVVFLKTSNKTMYYGIFRVDEDRIGSLFLIFEGEDLYGNFNSIEVQLQIMDNIPPKIGSIQDYPAYVNQTIYIEPTIHDNIQVLNTVWSLNGQEWDRSFFEYSFDASGDYQVFLNATDTSGNYDEINFTIHVLPIDHDTDYDGIPDLVEIRYGLNIKNHRDAKRDLDNDGLSNVEEYRNGTFLDQSDSDGDGMPDGWEVKHGLDPLSYSKIEDSDGDGRTDWEEYMDGSDPSKKEKNNFFSGSIIIVLIIIGIILLTILGTIILRSIYRKKMDYEE